MRWVTRLTTVAVIAIAIGGIALALRAKLPARYVGGEFRTHAMFHDASRLAVGAAVVIAGVQVGVIDKLTIEGDLARIDLRLRDDLELPADSFATKRADSLFGDSYIEIVPCCDEGSANRRLAPGEPIAHIVEGGSTDTVLRNIAAAMPKIDHALGAMHDFAIQGRSWVSGPVADRITGADTWVAEGHIERPIASAGRVVSRIDDATVRISDALATGGPEALRTLDRIDGAITSARGKMHDARDGLVSALGDARAGLDRIDPQLDQAREYVTAINEGRGTDWKGTLGRLVNEPELGNTIEDFTDDARDAVAGLNRFRSWIGGRVEVDAFSRDFRFYASAELRARNDKFYLIEIERGPLGALPHDALSDVVHSVDYTRTQTIGDGPRFTFQFGKQIGRVALRGGIKDSTFGIGADALMLDGALKLSADGYGSFTATPRIKLTGALAVFHSIYVLAGVDDALNTPGYLRVVSGTPGAPQVLDKVRFGRDYFLGTSLQFTDEDIAVLLRIYGAALVGALL